MAIVGNFNSLQKNISINKLYNDIVFSYINQAISDSSEINKRILGSPIGTFNKVFLSDKIYALEQVFLTKERVNCFFESHLNYIDLQLVLKGSELMELCDINKLTVKSKYNEETDFIIYHTPDSNLTSKLLLQKNDMAIFFPQDGHMGLSMSNNESIVFKTVIKVHSELWNI